MCSSRAAAGRTYHASKARRPPTVWRRLKRWGEEGIWERIWRAALAVLDAQGKLDWSIAFLDGSFVPAKKGARRSA